jgi:hypothetical protein
MSKHKIYSCFGGVAVLVWLAGLEVGILEQTRTAWSPGHALVYALRLKCCDDGWKPRFGVFVLLPGFGGVSCTDMLTFTITMWKYVSHKLQRMMTCSSQAVSSQEKERSLD